MRIGMLFKLMADEIANEIRAGSLAVFPRRSLRSDGGTGCGILQVQLSSSWVFLQLLLLVETIGTAVQT